MNEYKHTLTEAFLYQRNGALFQWAQDYLRTDGNNEKLADYLDEHNPTTIELIEFPLSKLVRIIGPEDGLKFREPQDVWESRVISLKQSIKKGVKFPPLIVTDFWGDLQLSDGSHRHEALIRSGFKKYWTIFFFSKPEKSTSIRQLVEQYKRNY